MPPNLTRSVHALTRAPLALGLRLAALLATGAANALPAQSRPFEEIDRYVAQEMARQHIPGLALGVYHHGTIVLVKGYGLANVELAVPVSPVTIFQSGSVGKQFTATAILMLVESHQLALDDTITKFFPGAPATWKSITIRQLLSHTSGLSDYTSDEHIKPGGPINYRVDYTEDSLVRIIASFPPDFPPGERWEYSNTNYVLLGAIIRKVTGKFYGDFLQARIFVPLGMTSTRVISEEDIVPNRAAGYRLKDGTLKNQEWAAPMLNTTADGSLYFNVIDLAKWDGGLSGERLLTRASLDTMWTVARLKDGRPNPANYGFAWGIGEVKGRRLVEHSGSWQGFTTFIARYLDDSFTVVVLTNLDSDHASPGTIAHGVARLYQPALAYHAIPDGTPDVTALVKRFFAMRVGAAPDPATVTDSLAKELTPGWSESRAHSTALGPPKSVVLVERRSQEGRTAYRYLVAFAKETQVAIVTVSDDGRLDTAQVAEY